ncbi:MAG: methyltransferase [Kineosporiaceae bacterium]
MSSGQHYFSEQQSGSVERRTLEVRLAGREVAVVTAGNVFSGDRLDLGTRVLLRDVPAPPAAGNLLDLGCGWGPLALTLAMHSPGARVWAVDVNPLARELTAENAAAHRLTNLTVSAPEEIPTDLRFAAIWSNPPIRIGKPALHALLQQWLPRLAEDGHAYLVVQRHLGADSLHAWLAHLLPEALPSHTVRRLGSAKGYRVLEVLPR